MSKIMGLAIGICLALVGARALAAHSDMESKAFPIGHKSVPFEVSSKQHLTISADCVADGWLKACDASKALKVANLKNLKRDAFGRNPGALICSEQVGGTVVWSVDPMGNERTFCAFHDGSLVGTGTLMYYGMRNKTTR